jgi:alpha-D-ribose 1-methylphosphonate 5-triphosphate synthase subunit PhnH
MPALDLSCLDNHRCFRLLLQAMSRPGTLFQLPAANIPARSPLLRLLDALIDQQCSCCLIDSDPGWEAQLQQQTGCSFCPVNQADFLLALGGTSRGGLQQAKRGRRDFPDQNATIIYQVDKLAAGTAQSGIQLRGPGINGSIHPCIEGLAETELQQLKSVNLEFPLGIDAFFLDRTGQLIGLPRSTRIGAQ